MHILQIPSFLPPYGGYFCIEQARALQARGHEVRLLLAQQLGLTIYPWHFITAPYGRWYEEDSGITIYRTNYRGIPRSVRHNQQRYCHIVSSMFDDYVSRYGTPDIIHAQCCKWAGVAAHAISQRTGIPFFITEHMSRGAYERDFGHDWQHHVWAKSLLSASYHAAQCVIPVADELVSDTQSFFGDDYRYQTVSNITDVDYYKYKVREPLAGRPFRFCCLAVSNKGEFYRKGYDVLAKAFRDITNCQLHIAGRNTDSHRFANLFEQYYGQQIDSSSIVIHGDLSRHDVRQMLYHCDALVLASRSEVQPLVVMEAMATGIPVVATEAIPQSERIPAATIVVPIDNADALHNAMLTAMSIPSSHEISRHVADISSPDIIAAKLEEIFSHADGKIN